MTISVRCPKCGHGYQLRDELAGKQAKCRCGQTLEIPVATTLTSLLDEEHIGQSPDEFGAAMPPAGAPASRTQSSPQFGAAFGKKKKRRGKGNNNQAVIIGSVVGGVAVLFVVLLLAFLLTGSGDTPAVAPASRPPASARPAPVASLPGQATPQETFESFKTAWVGGDWARVYSLMTPEAQNQMTTVIAMMGASFGPLCPELSAVAKQHGVGPMGLGALGGMPLDDADPFAVDEGNAADPAKPDAGSFLAQAIGVSAPIKDKKAFFVAVTPVFVKFLQSEQLAAIAKLGSVSITDVLGMLPIFNATTALSGLQVNGQTAGGLAKTPPPATHSGAPQGGKEKVTPLKFNQLSGSWYIGAVL